MQTSAHTGHDTTPKQTPQHHIAEAWETTRIAANQLPLPERIRAYAELIRRAAAQIKTATEIAALLTAITAHDAQAAWRHHHRRHHAPPNAPQYAPTPDRPRTEQEPDAARATRAAQVTITTRRAIGTGTAIHTPAGDPRDLIATAAHVTGPRNSEATVTTADGTRHKARVIATDPDADAALVEITPPRTNPPRVHLAGPSPPPNTPIYHHAAGTHKPSNLERGEVRTTYRPDGMDTYHISVSEGDSGGGIFDARTGRLVGVISSTTRLNNRGIVFGANALRLNHLTQTE